MLLYERHGDDFRLKTIDWITPETKAMKNPHPSDSKPLFFQPRRNVHRPALCKSLFSDALSNVYKLAHFFIYGN